MDDSSSTNSLELINMNTVLLSEYDLDEGILTIDVPFEAYCRRYPDYLECRVYDV